MCWRPIAEELLVDFFTVDAAVDGLAYLRVQVGLVRLIEAVLELFGQAWPRFFGVLDAADNERNLDGGQFALQHGQSGVLCVNVQLPADLADVNLIGLELGQTRGFLGNQDVFHLFEERRTAIVVRVTRVDEVDVDGALLKDPRAHADGLFLQLLDALGFVLSLGIHEQVSLLGGSEEVHEGARGIEVKLHGIVVDRDDVGKQFLFGVAEQAAEEPGVSGDRVFPNDELSAYRNVVGGEPTPVAVEVHVVPEEEGPLGPIRVGFPTGCEARNQRAIETVGVHQRVGEGPHLGIGGGGRPEPATCQLLDWEGC